MNNKLLALTAAAALCVAAACSHTGPLPRAKATPEQSEAFQVWQDSVEASHSKAPDFQIWMHNIMVLKDGKVILEKDFDPVWPADRPQHLFSVSKTFTALAVGLAVSDGLLTVDDTVIDFFPDKLPSEINDNLRAMKVKDLLTMQGGHETDPTWACMEAYDSTEMFLPLKPGIDLAKAFFSHPFVHQPGTYFCYNSLGTYILSALVQKVEGKPIVELLDQRVFSPLGIETPVWDADEEGVCCGGWGLHLKLEDMAKIGQLLLQKGNWHGKQLIPAEWIEEQTRKHIDNYPNGLTAEQIDQPPFYPITRNDWVAGYGYQTWRNTVGGFRADGAWGQMIIVVPEKNVVIAARANLINHQIELWSFWDYLLSAL